MGAAAVIREWWHDLLGVLFPNVCHVCGTTLVKGEEVMCLNCRLGLPRTNFHLNPDNDMAIRLAATSVKIERAAAFFHYYRESPYARLIHLTKYNGLPVVGRTLAADYARELVAEGFLEGIDMLIPVPLHRSKQRRRGYNQAREIALGISDATGIPVADNLIATRAHLSQTRLGSFGRWLNARDTYDARDCDRIAGLHVMIIDDVLTTGATILACAEAIHRHSPTTRISALTLAAAHLR